MAIQNIDCSSPSPKINQPCQPLTQSVEPMPLSFRGQCRPECSLLSCDGQRLCKDETPKILQAEALNCLSQSQYLESHSSSDIYQTVDFEPPLVSGGSRDMFELSRPLLISGSHLKEEIPAVDRGGIDSSLVISNILPQAPSPAHVVISVAPADDDRPISAQGTAIPVQNLMQNQRSSGIGDATTGWQHSQHVMASVLGKAPAVTESEPNMSLPSPHLIPLCPGGDDRIERTPPAAVDLQPPKSVPLLQPTNSVSLILLNSSPLPWWMKCGPLAPGLVALWVRLRTLVTRLSAFTKREPSTEGEGTWESSSLDRSLIDPTTRFPKEAEKERFGPVDCLSFLPEAKIQEPDLGRRMECQTTCTEVGSSKEDNGARLVELEEEAQVLSRALSAAHQVSLCTV